MRSKIHRRIIRTGAIGLMGGALFNATGCSDDNTQIWEPLSLRNSSPSQYTVHMGTLSILGANLRTSPQVLEDNSDGSTNRYGGEYNITGLVNPTLHTGDINGPYACVITQDIGTICVATSLTQTEEGITLNNPSNLSSNSQPSNTKPPQGFTFK